MGLDWNVTCCCYDLPNPQIANIRSTELAYIEKYRDVETLELDVGDDAFVFAISIGSFPWKRLFTMDELDKLPLTRFILGRCRYLKSIRIVDSGCKSVRTEADMIMWKRNLLALQDIMQLRLDLRMKLPSQHPLALGLADGNKAEQEKEEAKEAARNDSVQGMDPGYAAEEAAKMLMHMRAA